MNEIECVARLWIRLLPKVIEDHGLLLAKFYIEEWLGTRRLTEARARDHAA